MIGCVAKLKRDVKALSPIFAVLILIAVAVIAGIMMYMFTSGYLATMMGGGTAGQEKVAIEAVAANASTGTVTVYCKSTGGGTVDVTEAILKNSAGQTLDVDYDVVGPLPADGTLLAVSCTFATDKVVAGNTYTVTLVTKEGNQFVSATFKAYGGSVAD